MKALARQFVKYPFLVAAALIVLLLILEIFLFPIYIDTCQENDHYCDYYTTRENIAFVFVRIVAKFLDDHNGTVAAIATMAIAWFTWTLKTSTDKLWSAGEKQHATINRAFVVLDGFNVELTTAADISVEITELPVRYRDRHELFITRIAVQPKWKNSGNTPTKEMTINVDYRGPIGPIPPDHTYRQQSRSFFLAPGTIERSEIFEIPEARSLVDYGLLAEGSQPMVFIWGRADYKDIFGDGHFIEWCYELRLSAPNKKLGVSFVQYGDHNRSD